MAIESPVATTLTYLRFPLRADHRARLCDGSHCPHCHCARIQKWGHFAGRQRFRCRDCRRTFSTFTGTPLRYLKRPERWRTFLWCMEGRLTVRATGAVLDVDKNTALRWRHRVLDHWRTEPRRRLRGSVAVADFWMPLNEKGARNLRRTSRRHGYAPGRRERVERFPLTAAVEIAGHGATDHRIACGAVCSVSDYARFLGPRLGDVHEIVGGRGRLCALARFAKSAGVPYMPANPLARTSCAAVRRELRQWLRPFRGVASRRLNNYLEWFWRTKGSGGWPGRSPSALHMSRIQRHRSGNGSLVGRPP